MLESGGESEMSSHWAETARSDWLRPLGLVIGSIVLLFVLGLAEARWLSELPWARSLYTTDTVLVAPDAVEVWTRTLPLEASLSPGGLARLIQDDLLRAARVAGPSKVNTDFFPRNRVVMVDLTQLEKADALLAAGRLPEPGSREVLAGPLLPDTPLTMDGQTFEVVGRIHSQAAGFTKTYLVPHAPDVQRAYFTKVVGATRGSLLVEPGGRMQSLLPEFFQADPANRPEVFGGPVKTRPGIAWMTWGCLIVVAIGACGLYRALCAWLARMPIPILAPAMRETLLHPRLLHGLQMACFGLFFGTMAWGLLDPELNYFVTQYASHEFTEGGLRYVGEAYDSGNIPQAALATWYNNFYIQTLFYTAGLSLFPPFILGIFKVFASFAIVGFAMAPAWAGTATGMSYHAITLGLELPPYTIAAFGVALWAAYTWRLIWAPVVRWYLGSHGGEGTRITDALAQFPRGLIALAGGVIFCAVVLFVAAWYEAVTLILFR